MAVLYGIRMLFYVNTNATNAVHLGGLKVFYFLVTDVPRCLVVKPIKLNTVVVMVYSAKIGAYSAEHCARVNSGTFGPVRPRPSAAASAGTRASGRTLLAKQNPEM
jgi:hypothetical protein